MQGRKVVAGMKSLLAKAWYDYCITNRLIAYGEVPELTEEQVEARCKEQFEKDCAEIRSKYGKYGKYGK